MRRVWHYSQDVPNKGSGALDLLEEVLIHPL
jgi:hypothetical protein